MQRRHMLAALAMALAANLRAARAGSLLDNLTSGNTGGLGDTLGGLTGSGNASSSGLGTSEIIDGLKQALEIGTQRAVATVGVTNGFNANPAIHIPLPATLAKVQSALKMIGMSQLADDLELKMNRAAEQASAKATDIFWSAIKGMSVKDARGILDGPDDAATQYLRRTTGSQLKDEMRPIVDRSLADVGAIKAYDKMMGRYDTIPFMPNVKADVTDYTLNKTLDGLFYYVAREEAAIRKDPVKRTTALLRKVFAQ